jgi:hypothetical protein
MASTTTATTSAPATAVSENTANGYRLPETNTLLQAAKLAIVEDRPVLYDYWTGSLEKKAIIGVRENKEKLLVKSEDEYTSPIAKIFKVGKEYIVVTENSIYIVDVEIPTKRIS